MSTEQAEQVREHTRGSKIQWEYLQVTPELASEFLGKTECNTRPVDLATVENYVQEILDGEFVDGHEAIAFDEHGCLVDGVHRCEAIVRAGVTLPMWAAKGVPSDFFDKMNRGRNRSFADVVAAERRIEAPDAKIIVAATTITAKVDMRMPKQKWRQSKAFKPSARTFRLMAEKYAIPHQLLEHTNAAARGTKMQKGVVLAGAYLIQRKCPDAPVVSFLQGLGTGKGITDARVQLRDHTRGLKGERKKAWDQFTQLSALLHCWNAWARGTELKNLQPSAFERLPSSIREPVDKLPE
ncbi:hypothetical protein ABZ543_12850 [Streptomyces roseifaciens]